MALKKLQMDADNPVFDEEISADEQADISAMFGAKQESEAVNQEKTTEIPIENIIPSKHNKFEPYTGEKKQAMIDLH